MPVPVADVREAAGFTLLEEDSIHPAHRFVVPWAARTHAEQRKEKEE